MSHIIWSEANSEELPHLAPLLLVLLPSPLKSGALSLLAPLVVVFLLNEIISHPLHPSPHATHLAQSRSEGPPSACCWFECSGREKKHTIRHRWLSASWCPARLPLQRAILPPSRLPASVIQMRDSMSVILKVQFQLSAFYFCSSWASRGQILFLPWGWHRIKWCHYLLDYKNSVVKSERYHLVPLPWWFEGK